MSLRKTLLLLILISIPIIRIAAITQVKEIINYKGKTYYFIHDNAVDYLNLPSDKREALFARTEGRPENRACERGYLAEWTVEDDVLYLTRIVRTSETKQEPDIENNLETANLADFYGSMAKSGKVRASWLNTDLICSHGRVLNKDKDNPISEFEKQFIIRDGQLKKINDLDNSKRYKFISSDYSDYTEKLSKHFEDNLNFNSTKTNFRRQKYKIREFIPDNRINLFVLFYTDSSGKINRTKLMNLSSYPDDNTLLKKEYIYNEIIDVVNKIPQWKVKFIDKEFQNEPNELKAVITYDEEDKILIVLKINSHRFNVIYNPTTGVTEIVNTHAI